MARGRSNQRKESIGIGRGVGKATTSIGSYAWELIHVSTRRIFGTNLLMVHLVYLSTCWKLGYFFTRSAVRRIMMSSGVGFEVEKFTEQKTLGYGRQRVKNLLAQ